MTYFFIGLILGLIVGGVIVFLLTNGKSKKTKQLESQIKTEKQKIKALQETANEIKNPSSPISNDDLLNQLRSFAN